MDESKLSLTEHLTELRARMIIAVAGVFVTTGLAALFSPELLDYSIQPLLRVLEDKARVETLVIHADEERAAALATLVAENPRTRVGAPLVGFDTLRSLAQEAVAKKNPVDLVLVSSAALGEAGVLAADVLAGIEPPPYVLYLVPSKDDPLVEELVLDGANVILEPPRAIALSRHVRRAAGAAGKSAAVDKLVVLSPLDPFFAYLKIALVIGLFAACPIWLYQAWRFVAPGLYRSERRAVLPLVVSSYGLFLLGGCFAYFTILPFTNSFFIGSASPDILQQWSIAQYLTYSAVTLLSMGAVFQIPLVMGFAARVGAATSAWFRSFRRYMWVVIWFVAAIITPPDVISQSLLAGPMMVLYEIGILWSRVQERRAAARPVEPDEDEEDDLDPEPGAAKG